MRRELRRWLRHIHDETGVTTVFVTHDQEEALDLADRVAILKDGHIEQVDTPLDLYQHPSSAFVHDFLGGAVHLPAKVQDGVLTVDGWTTDAPEDAPAADVILAVRGEDLILSEQGITASIVTLSPRGPRTRIGIEIEGQALDLERPAHDPLSKLSVGQTVRVRPDLIHLFKS